MKELLREQIEELSAIIKVANIYTTNRLRKIRTNLQTVLKELEERDDG